jgi:hypothetical protein
MIPRRSLIFLGAGLLAAAALAATSDAPTRQLVPSDLASLSWRGIGPARMDGRVSALA